MTEPQERLEVPPRYRVIRRLGEGGMGVVYAVEDLERGGEVALKTIREVEGESLYRFKREFRALRQISHPNLVSLYELFSEGGRWYYTMELIEGQDFLSYVRPASEDTEAVPEDDLDKTVSSRGRSAAQKDQEPTEILDTVISGESSSPPAFSGGTGPRNLGSLSEARLRGALLQLAAGVHALHRSGRLHRDLKPTNVLVESSGRVVILDFGLVAELERGRDHESTFDHIVGTAAYMSPEQAAGSVVSPASDWYSVGVMLFEALSAARPFHGTPMEVLLRKQRESAPSLQKLAPDAPEELRELAQDLVRSKPIERPEGEGVLRALGTSEQSGVLIFKPLEKTELIGRVEELQSLERGRGLVRSGRAVRVDIRGPSGVGKSALVTRFVNGLTHLVDAVALRGSCYEREDLPFKAFDVVVDALARFLRTLVHEDLEAVLPEDTPSLARLFPVLKQVRSIRERAPSDAGSARDPAELQQRAFVALRSLLAKLGRRLPIILVIDDAQWGDADSAALLTALLAPPAPPTIMVVLCYRDDDRGSSPFLRTLDEIQTRVEGPNISTLGGPSDTVDRITLELGPLQRSEAEMLAWSLIGPGQNRAELAGRVAKEAAGHPHLIERFAEALVARPEEVSLNDALWNRLSGLPTPVRRLLEVICVAGRPVLRDVLMRAAEVQVRQEEALSLLTSNELVRSLPSTKGQALTAYHARIREAVLENMKAPQIVAFHRALALALEEEGSFDPEALAMHWTYASEPERAAPHAERAARRAEEALAFVRAATLYRLALKGASSSRTRLLEALGDCLTSAGYGPEAAQYYLEAASSVRGEMGLSLHHKAASQLLRSGHVDQGKAVIEEVLQALGMALADGPRRQLALLARSRIAVRLRGLRFTRRSEDEVEPALLHKIDALWSVSTGLGMVDSLLASDYQSRGLLLCLQAGEPMRLARALAMEACFSAGQGERSQRRTRALLDRASELAQALEVPYLRGLQHMSRGICAFLEGRFLEGRSASTKAESVFRLDCQGVAWEIATAQAFQVMSMAWLGALQALSHFVQRGQEEALRRGDRYAIANLRSGMGNLAWLCADDADGARAALEETRAHLPKGAISLPHVYELLARMNLELYEGNGALADATLKAMRTQLERSIAFKVQYLRIELLFLGARAALSAPDNPGAADRASGYAGLLHAEEVLHARALAILIRAQLTHQKGDLSGAEVGYQAASRAFSKLDMQLHSDLAQRAASRLLSGEGGNETLEAQGVVAPDKFALVFLPVERKRP